MSFKEKIIPSAAKAAILTALAETGTSAFASMQKPLEALKVKNQALTDAAAKFENLKATVKPLIDTPLELITSGFSTDLFFAAQPYLAAFYLAVTGYFYLTHKTSDKPKDAADYGSHGKTRWASFYEIFDKVDITHDFKQPGIILARYKKKTMILTDESFLNKNVAIFGGAGAGKTLSLIKPNIINTTNKSLVITDPKGELFEETSAIKKAQGYEIRLVNFSDPSASDRYNALDYIREPADADTVTHTLLTNTSKSASDQKTDFWSKAEISLVASLLLYVKYVLPKEQQHMGSVFELLIAPFEHIHFLFLSLPEDHIAKRAYFQAISKLQGKTAADVFTTASVSMNLWKYQDICDFTSTSDFHFHDLAHKKVALYVILPIAQRRFRPLTSAFFDQLFSELYYVADNNFNRLPVPVSFLLDEFCNIGRLPEFEERLSTMRSYRMSVMMVIQSLGQLRNRWGKDLAEELIDNCDTKIFLGANNADSADFFAKQIGRTTIQTDSESNSKNRIGSSESSSKSYTGTQLMMAEDLLRLDKNDAVVLIRSKMPMHVQKAWLFKIKELKKIQLVPTSRKDYPFADRSKYDVFKPVQLIKELYEANGQQPLDLASFEGMGELVVNTADPDYQMRKMQEEKLQQMKEQQEKKEKRAAKKVTRKAAPKAAALPEDFLQAFNEAASKVATDMKKQPIHFEFTDADIPPEVDFAPSEAEHAPFLPNNAPFEYEHATPDPIPEQMPDQVADPKPIPDPVPTEAPIQEPIQREIGEQIPVQIPDQAPEPKRKEKPKRQQKVTVPADEEEDIEDLFDEFNF